MSELMPINIVIGDRTYRIKIAPKDEEVVRKTIKLINDKIIEFKTNFAGKDMQDYIAMVVIWFATEQGKVASGPNMVQKQEASQQLAALESLLDKLLSAEK